MSRSGAARVAVVLAVVTAAAWLIARSCAATPGTVTSPSTPSDTPDAAAPDDTPARRHVRVARPEPADDTAADADGPPRAEIRVVVTGPDGAPVRDGIVAFVPPNPRDEMPQVPLDADGRAVLRPVVGTDGVVSVVPRALPTWASGTLVAPAEGCDVEVRLAGGMSVEGIVLARDGVTPVSGARVSVAAHPDDRTLERLARGLGGRVVTADSDGRFRADGLRPGEVRLDARPPPEHADLGEHAYASVEAGASGVRLVLWRRKDVRFLPVDSATGLAPRCARLELVQVVRDREFSRHVQTSTADAPPGEPQAIPQRAIQVSGHEVLRYRVRATGYAPSAVIEVDPNAGPADEEIRVELHPDPGSVATLRLRVETEDGRVPPDVSVVTWSDDRRSSTGRTYPTSGGAIDVELAPGPCFLTVGAGTTYPPKTDEPWLHVPLELDVERGTALERSVVLPAGGFLRIVDDDGGFPDEPGVARRDGEQVDLRFHAMEDDGAWVQLSQAIPPGAYVLEWRENDGEWRRVACTVRPREVTEIVRPAN